MGNDIQQLQRPSEIEIEKQLQIFKKGIPFVQVVAAASADNGIEVLSEAEQLHYANVFEAKKEELELLKFVPASGAATRMFQFLHQFLDDFDPDSDRIEDYLEKEENKDLKVFFESYENFAFYNQVQEHLSQRYPTYSNFDTGRKYYFFVQEMLDESGMNFENLPKGLVPFHRYEDENYTAFEEQLYEAAFYADSKGVAQLHFTVSDEHQEKFHACFDEVCQHIQKKTAVKFVVSYSFQKKETDTVAATLDNRLFLDDSGNPVFRPSGHGALLENLNDVDADIVFIKNIDNVVSKDYVETIAFQKKVLAGRLISIQHRVFDYVKKLETGNVSNELINEISHFIEKEFEIPNVPKDKDSLLNLLDRPIRVCGVVENTGAPGGGPFLIKNKDGNHSYQIVEMSQIDLKNEQQKELVEKATHFNPVDLVCGVRNHRGEKYDLTAFCDPDTGFISEKSHQGRPIKALERPGLWNGAMAHWNTVFVEVPLITFNPVKTVNDLLDKAHQS